MGGEFNPHFSEVAESSVGGTLNGWMVCDGLCHGKYNL